SSAASGRRSGFMGRTLSVGDGDAPSHEAGSVPPAAARPCPLFRQDLRLGAGPGTPRAEGRFVPTGGSIRPEGRRRLFRSHEAVRPRPGETPTPSGIGPSRLEERLRQIVFFEIEAQVLAAGQQAAPARSGAGRPRAPAGAAG